MVFFNTDTQTDGHTNSIQNESPHYPILVRAKNFLYPIFSTSLKADKLSLVLLTYD